MPQTPQDQPVPFVERVDFPNTWTKAEEYGVSHDGYQGAGYLEAVMLWKEASTGRKGKVRLRIMPWLSYSCSVGVRMGVKTLGSAIKFIGTMLRVTDDGTDRCVVRPDAQEVRRMALARTGMRGGCDQVVIRW